MAYGLKAFSCDPVSFLFAVMEISTYTTKMQMIELYNKLHTVMWWE